MGKNIGTYLKLFFGMALYGSTLPVSKIVTENFPVFSASLIRVIIAALFLLPFIITRIPQLKKIQKKDYLSIFLISFSGVFLFSAFMLYGMKYSSGVTGSIVMSTTPAVTALGSFLFFKDKLTWKKIAALLLSVAGVVIINTAGSSEHASHVNWIGVLLVFLAVCAEASYTLLAKNIKSDIDPLDLTFITAFVSAFLFVIPSLFEINDINFARVSLSGWVSLAWWGLAGMGIASILWFGGIKKASGSVASGFMGIMSVSALVLSYAVLSEKFQWIHMAGFMLVITGVILISISHAEEMKNQS
jgi:drug/metabolite transporter (DMT)-like permease